MVSIVGRPNVGKSTLVNRILGEKVAIVSHVPQTTRNSIRGIYTEDRGQIVFIDTPGMHLEKDRLDKFMNVTSLDTIQSADCIVHLADVNRSVGEEEQMVVSRLKDIKAPIILALNKMDLKGQFVDQYVSLWRELKGDAFNDPSVFGMIAISGRTGRNVDKLIDLIFERLPEGQALYPEDTLCDLPQKIALADIVREKFLQVLRDELPHSLAVFIEEITPKKKNLTYVKVQVLVERESQKEIVIGKNGQLVKKVGMLARKELEDLLQTRVYLDIFVKAQENWRDDPSLLQELGYSFL